MSWFYLSSEKVLKSPSKIEVVRHLPLRNGYRLPFCEYIIPRGKATNLAPDGICSDEDEEAWEELKKEMEDFPDITQVLAAELFGEQIWVLSMGAKQNEDYFSELEEMDIDCE